MGLKLCLLCFRTKSKKAAFVAMRQSNDSRDHLDSLIENNMDASCTTIAYLEDRCATSLNRHGRKLTHS